MAFKEEIDKIHEIRDCFQNGIQAFRTNSVKIRVKLPRQLSGSVFLDECIHDLYPDDPRWDYFFCYRSEVYFVEIHPASTNEVTTVLNKLNWLKIWLKEKAPGINAMRAANFAFRWIASGDVRILRNSRYERMLAQNGLPFPKEVLDL